MNKCQFVPLHKWPRIRLGSYLFVIANNPCLVKQGMQWTKYLPRNTLMLFPQMKPGVLFHTNNCIPLDIAPISKSGKILDIWTVNPEQKGIGPAPSKTSRILEAPAGWFNEQGFQPGNIFPLLNS